MTSNPSNTPKGFRYPIYSDSPDVPRDLGNLASDIDAYLSVNKGPGYLVYSYSTINFVIGSQTFLTPQVTTVGSNYNPNGSGAYIAGDRVRIINASNTSQYMEGFVSSVMTNTSITVAIDTVNGTGSSSSWVFSITGLQGVQGTQGTQGLQGLQGVQGPQGTQGIQGRQGIQGLQGLQGPQGTQGIQGPQGTQGVQGLQGIQGPQGTQGIQGIQGTQGVQGLIGPASNATAIVGAEAATTGPLPNSPVYLQGTILGADGGYGRGATLTATTYGALTIDGYTPAVADVGDRILVKDQADPKQNGIYVLAQGDSTHYWQLTRSTDFDGWASPTQIFAGVFLTIYGGTAGSNLDTTWMMVAQEGSGTHDENIVVGVDSIIWSKTNGVAIQGIQGAQGTQGVQGTQGIQGTQGLQGFGYAQLQGIQGPQGPQGTQGTQGVQGTQGIQGQIGSQGTQGTQGLQGVQGSQGTQGIQGIQGPQGTQGIQGTQGVQGIQGLQGPQGTQGTQGVQGAQGLQGNIGTQGIQGFGYAQLQGIQGLQGLQGNASTHAFGVTPPLSPVIGQSWVNTNDGRTYTWDGTEWFETYDNLSGIQGIQGIQGTTTILTINPIFMIGGV